MTQPLVVVQNNFVAPLTAPAAIAARALGYTLHDISSGEIATSVPKGGPWGPILIIGSILFAHQWARNDPILGAWIFWDDAAYDAALWAEQLGDHYLNAEGQASTIGAFLTSDSPAMHIRPRGGTKMVGTRPPTESSVGPCSVAGLVASPAEIAALQIDPATPVWLAPPRAIESEVRVWMIDSEAVAASTYRVAGAHLRSVTHPFVAPAVARAQDLHRLWSPGRHYVVDLGLTAQGWRVVKYNPIHSSGWYDADPTSIIAAYMRAMRAKA